MMRNWSEIKRKQKENRFFFFKNFFWNFKILTLVVLGSRMGDDQFYTIEIFFVKTFFHNFFTWIVKQSKSLGGRNLGFDSFWILSSGGLLFVTSTVGRGLISAWARRCKKMMVKNGWKNGLWWKTGKQMKL